MKKKFNIEVGSGPKTKEEWLEKQGVKSKKKRLNVDLTKSIYNKFEMKCRSSEKKMSQVVREWIMKYLNE